MSNEDVNLAVISDLHLGVSSSTMTMTRPGSTSDEFDTLGFQQFTNALYEHGVDELDYLVLAGDIFDFSVVGYREAYEKAQDFFEALIQEQLTDQIIYVPGNHDASFWHTVQHEVSIVNKFKAGKFPEEFRHSEPGLLDLRPQSESSECRQIQLPGVSSREADKDHAYGGLFLDWIVPPGESEDDPPLTFHVAYPNFYVVDDEGSTLVTHGHYFGEYWSVLTEYGIDIAQTDLFPDYPNYTPDIEQLVAINFPVNQLACSGVGNAGILTDRIIEDFVQEVKKGDTERLERYLNRFDEQVEFRESDNWYEFRNQISSWIEDKATDRLIDEVVEAVSEARFARGDKTFLERNEELVNSYLKSVKKERQQISESTGDFDFEGEELPAVHQVIFGHTHQPHEPRQVDTDLSPMKDVTFGNTGAYMTSEGKPDAIDPMIYYYETGSGWSPLQAGSITDME